MAPGDAWFATWGSGCANVAVPVSTAMRERIWDAYQMVSVQGILGKLGYQAGPLGNIESPQLQAAIAQAKRDIGMRADMPIHQLWIIRFLLKATR